VSGGGRFRQAAGSVRYAGTEQGATMQRYHSSSTHLGGRHNVVYLDHPCTDDKCPHEHLIVITNDEFERFAKSLAWFGESARP
jgi:hypothetical protein